MKGVKGEIGEKVGHATVTDSKRAVIREGAPVSKPKRKDKPGTELTIVLPLPPRILWPNGRGGHYAKAKSVRTHRESAFFATREAMRAAKVSGGWERAESQDVFYFPDKRRRDTRNMEASLKPYFDGIVDAELLRDDNADVLRHLPSVFYFGNDNPRVEITVRMLATSPEPSG